jgi:outer membrane receptor protein involved in Fe transport
MNIRPSKGFAVSLTLIMGVFGSSVGFAQSTDESSESSEEEVVLEKFEVTGSRIARLDAETPNPVVSITADNIEAMGFPTISDAVRSLPFNNGQALTPTDSGTSFTPGVSSFNLRGLGNNATLVLINGRRAVPYARPGFDGNQTVFDLNSIPESAIESIDILKDGGSALYGSDAVAGVVNIRLKKNYVGAEASVEVGDYFDTGGMLKKASISVGTVGAKTSMFTNLMWMETDSVFSRDLPWSENADNTDIAPADYGRYEVNDGGLEAAGFDTIEEYVAALGLSQPTADGFWDNRSTRGFPGYLTVPGLGRRTFTEPTNNPTIAGSVPGRNFYNYNETNGLLPETERWNLYTQLDHEITEHLTLFAELSFSRSEAVVYSAAAPVDIENSKGLDSSSVLTYPSYNPFNPFGVDISNGRRRLIELPNRISDVTSDTPRFVAGLRGDLEYTDGAFQEWNWEVAGMYSKNTVNSISRNAGVDYKLQQAFNGLTRLGDGSFTWDSSTPLNERHYFNWFGYNEQAFADFIGVENPNSDSVEYRMFDFRMDGPAFDLPGGQVGLAFGGEYRDEEMEHIQSDLNATGMILAGSEGTSWAGTRQLTAFYAEASLPFHEMLEVQLAGRYESYSDDGFDEKIRPKAAVKFRPFDWVIFRASFAESFKAPDLSYLNTQGLTTFSSNQVLDPVTNQIIDQIQVKAAGNPNLEPETTDTIFVGVAFEPGGVLDGLSFSVDYFNFDQTNLLAQLSDIYSYAEFLQEEFNGNPLFAGKVVRDGTGNVLFIKDDYENISSAEYTGFDFEIRYHWDTNSLGSFVVGANATWVDSYTVDGDELVGSYLTPEWNGTANFGWSYKDWNVNAFAVYRGERTRSLSFGNIFTPDDELFLVYDVAEQITLNLSATYRGFEKTTVTVGVNNALNDAPPLDGFDALGTTPGVNDALPAYWYVRLTREF